MRDSYGFRENQFGYTRKEPIGVCGLITPWNFPLLMATFKMAPMLASGSTGVHKCAENAPLSSLMMADLWNQVEGVPPGVLNSLPGLGSVAGEALVDHKDVSMIGFTGSTAIGKRIISRGTQANMKRVKLELGGKGPLIVFNDGDVDKAVQSTVKHGMACSGQFCGAPTRLIIQDQVHDQFVEKLSNELQKLKFGYWREEGQTHGPVASQTQLTKIMNYIQSGKEQGAKLALGGNQIDRPGFFVEPTLFTDVTRDMKIA